MEYNLFDCVVDFCNKKYIDYGISCGHSGNCNNTHECNHPNGKCSKIDNRSCEYCLNQIHFGKKNQKEGKEQGEVRASYDCPKLINYYVCRYSYGYMSELYAIFKKNYVKSFLVGFNSYDILSLGCGACPDLMALELLNKQENIKKNIKYTGIDNNEYWVEVKDRIEHYVKGNQATINAFNYYNNDVYKFFDEYTGEYNIVCINYLISSLYNTDQIKKTDNERVKELVRKIVNGFINNRNKYMIIIINDTNNNEYANNCTIFEDFISIFNETKELKYIKYNNYFDKNSECVDHPFEFPDKLDPFQPNKGRILNNFSAQLILEVTKIA